MNICLIALDRYKIEIQCAEAKRGKNLKAPLAFLLSISKVFSLTILVLKTFFIALSIFSLATIYLHYLATAYSVV